MSTKTLQAPRVHKDTPLLMKGPLVVRTMARTKTVTRRPVEKQPVLITPRGYVIPKYWALGDNRYPVTLGRAMMAQELLEESPWGKRGDTLWVRETLRLGKDGAWFYDADGAPVTVAPEHKQDMLIWAHHKEQDYCPSIHMPRWACRVRLLIKEVRVEPITDITVEDIIKEGFSTQLREHDACVDLEEQFERSWNEIYPEAKFENSTWVYVIRYGLVKAK